MKFSVIVAVNEAKTAWICTVKSAMNQSLGVDGGYEILIVGHPSAEETFRALPKPYKSGVSIRIIEKHEIYGPGVARNRSLDEASGDYVVFLDPGDRLRSDALEQYGRLISAATPDVVLSGLVLQKLADYKQLAIRRPAAFRAAAWRRRFLSSGGVKFTASRFHEDIEFVVRGVLSAQTVLGVKDRLCYTHPDPSGAPSFREIDDAAAALELLPNVLAERQSLAPHLCDWKFLAKNICRTLARRAGSASPVDQDIKARFEDRLRQSAVLKQYGLIGSLLRTVHAGFKPSTATTGKLARAEAERLRKAAAGAVVMVADIDYQVRNFVAIARILNTLGVKTVLCDVSNSSRASVKRTISGREAATYTDLNFFQFDQVAVDPLFFNARAYLVGVDWGPLRDLVFALKLNQIPVIGFYEGINDDFLLEPPSPPAVKFLPYRNVDHLLLPGEYYLPFYAGFNPQVVGLPVVRSLMDEEVCFPPEPKVVINVNFSYGVLEESRMVYLKTVVEACQRLNLPFIISQHPADLADLSAYPKSTRSVYEELKGCSILVSRFSTCILEGLALGKPVIYHNPHKEKFPKFQNDPLGAFDVTDSVESLMGALEKALIAIADGINIRDRARVFLQRHAGLFDPHPPERRAAEAIRMILWEREDEFQARILDRAGFKPDWPDFTAKPTDFRIRLGPKYATANKITKGLIALLIDRPGLKRHLSGLTRQRHIRALIDLIPD